MKYSLVIVAFFGLCLRASLLSLTAAEKYEAVALPLRCDEKYVQSTLMMRFPREDYDGAAGLGNIDIRTEFEAAFARLCEALTEPDASALSEIPRNSNGSGSGQQALNAYHSFFSARMNECQIMCRLPFDEDREAFVWNVPLGGTEDRRATRIFQFTRNSDGQVCIDLGRQAPILSVLNRLFQNCLDTGSGPHWMETVSTDYSVPLEVENSAKEVMLHFDGERLNFDIASGEGYRGEHAEVELFARVYGGANRTVDEVAEGFERYLTQDSKKRYSRWKSQAARNYFRTFWEERLRVRKRIYFIIEAYPISILFFADPKQEVGSLRMRYEYLFYDENEKRHYLTNFYYETFFDDLISDRELGVRSELRRLMLNSD